MELTTVSDINYLVKGLTLYRSLCESGSEFNLNYLCLDEESFQRLVSLRLPNLKPFRYNEIIDGDPVAEKLMEQDRWLFCMAMASYFSRFIMKNGAESVTYIDSDIYFHKSINLMEDEFSGKDIAIFRHRQFPLDTPRPEGWFNVGVVYFKNSKFGKKILDWWADAVVNRKYPELATCGDQKYLDRFLDMCPEEMIYADGNIGHGAPWQWQLYGFEGYRERGTIEYEGKEQALYFTHFSQFSVDFIRDKYVPSTMHYIYTPLEYYSQNKELESIYRNYFDELKKTNSLYLK